MINQLLVTLTNSVLGIGKSTSRGNYSYNCPFCNHPKPKLEIQLIESKDKTNKWHCWHCDKKGKTLYSLFKQIKVPNNKLEELKSITNSSFFQEEKLNINEEVSLPKEFKPLYEEGSTIEYRQALNYLKKRNIFIDDIIKYNIGYCEYGKYKNRIIIPTYNEKGNLNYFIARSFEKNPYYKYINPPFSRDIIPNEHFINWDLPIIICEGLFDSMAIKRNVIPLLGKNIQTSLMKKLVKSKVDKIYIALDKDAIKKSLKFCEILLNEGKEVYWVNINEKDPSDLGFELFTKNIQNTNPLSYEDLLKLKLTL